MPVQYLSSASLAAIDRQKKQQFANEPIQKIEHKDNKKKIILALAGLAVSGAAAIGIYALTNNKKNAKFVVQKAQQQLKDFNKLIDSANSVSYKELESLGKNFEFSGDLQKREFYATLYSKARQESEFIDAQLKEYAPLVGNNGKLSLVYQNVARILKLVSEGKIVQDEIFDDLYLSNYMNYLKDIEIRELKMPELSKEYKDLCFKSALSLDEIGKEIDRVAANIEASKRDSFGDPALFCLKTKDAYAELVTAYEEKSTEGFIAAGKKIKEILESNYYKFEWFDENMPEQKRVVNYIIGEVELPAICKVKNKADTILSVGKVLK